MKQMVCEMCESTAFMKEDGAFVCQGCGMKYSQEEAKKLMVEVEGGPVVTAPAAPQSNELENLYELARRARKDDNGENAAKYYEMILLKAPLDWEAAFFSVYYKATQCKIAHISSAANSVENCLGNVFALIRDHVKEPDEQKKAVRAVVNHSELISLMLANGAKNHYRGIDASIQSNYTQEMINNVCAARNIVYTCGNQLEQTFGETYGTMCAEAWKQGVKLHEELLSRLADQTGNRIAIKSYIDKIGKYDKAYAKNARIQDLEAQISACRKTIEKTKTSMGFGVAGIIFLICAVVLLNMARFYGAWMYPLAVLAVLFALLDFRGPGVVERRKKIVEEAKENLEKCSAELEQLKKEK